ncbi:Uncharacterised protein [uncultured archaeon]|nr:Uncharacterised protein [uncultured archaeon]
MVPLMPLVAMASGIRWKKAAASIEPPAMATKRGRSWCSSLSLMLRVNTPIREIALTAMVASMMLSNTI